MAGEGVLWSSYFSLGDDFRQQKGQVDTWILAAAARKDAEIAWLIEFCTGYGKTLTAYGAYWILRERGLVTNMLVCVPTDDQRLQFAEDVEKANRLLGIDLAPAWVVEKTPRELRVVQRGLADVFVCSYQQLEAGSGAVEQMLETQGTWMGVADECHHLGEDGEWATRFHKLPVRIRVGLSATPIRRDRARLLGVPNEPTVRITYQEAYQEEVVKRVVGKIEHYFLDVDMDGQRSRLTTESLKDEGVTDFSRYEVKRQLRYNNNYLAQMLIDPLRDLNRREAIYPHQNQMIIFAMTCRHAHYICDQINALCEQLGLPYRAEWIGVGEGMNGATKSPEENRHLSKAFKGGTGEDKPAGFHILVQVAKAEEGFDVTRASVLVFLHLIGADTKLLQQIGRGLRRNRALPFDQDSVSVYASAETQIAAIIERMEVEARQVREGEYEPTGPRQLGLWDIPDLILIDSTHERTDIVLPHGIEWIDQEARDFCSRWNIPEYEYLRHFAAVPRSPGSSLTASEPSPQQHLKLLSDQVQRHTSTLVGNIVRLLKNQGVSLDGRQIGAIKRSVNAEWTRSTGGMVHSEMLPEEFKRKHKWLQTMNQVLQETGEVPGWVEW